MLQSSCRNKLIRSMTPDDFDGLRRNLEPVELQQRQILVQRNAIVPFVYFLESGQASVLAKVSGSEAIEVAMIGREGMTDMVPAKKVPLETVVQISGEALRIEREFFTRQMERSVDLANIVTRWQHSLLVLTSFTALSHGSFTVVERLARYMLMLHDRLDGDELPLVHEFFAWMLAVRRAGVTAAVNELKRLGAIDSGRGYVRVLDRDILIDVANNSYGPPEAEYEKLFGDGV